MNGHEDQDQYGRPEGSPVDTVPPEHSFDAESSILTKLVAVCASLPETVATTGRNAHFAYNYASESDVLRAVRPAFIAQGLMLLPEILKVDDVTTRDAKTDGAKTITKTTVQTTVYYRFTIADSKSGETIALRWVGRGEDPSDKGPYKAMTGALKYLLRQLTLMAWGGEDAEGDAGTDRRAARRSGSPQKAKPNCPNCGMELRVSQQDGEYYCWKQKGGCGAKWGIGEGGTVLGAGQAGGGGQSGSGSSSRATPPTPPPASPPTGRASTPIARQPAPRTITRESLADASLPQAWGSFYQVVKESGFTLSAAPLDENEYKTGWLRKRVFGSALGRIPDTLKSLTTEEVTRGTAWVRKHLVGREVTNQDNWLPLQPIKER